MPRLAAITGAGGFLGRHLVRAFADEGWDVRLLMRRDPIQNLWRDIEPQVVLGDLADERALGRLCDGADAVINCAGLVKARSRAEYDTVNAQGAARTASAAKSKGVRHFLQVSSLAAREPQLSDYAASKRAGEDAAAQAFGGAITVARPPAIYGPGDLETFGLFRAAAKSPVLPVFDPRTRIALIHVSDAARQIEALAAGQPGRTVTLCDVRPEGYSWREIVEAAAAAVGRKPHLLAVPEALISAAGLMSAVIRLGGGVPMLSRGKARELRHRNWAVEASERGENLPASRFGLPEGFADTVTWCRRAGWLAN